VADNSLRVTRTVRPSEKAGDEEGGLFRQLNSPTLGQRLTAIVDNAIQR
jgi:hypothetical protein